MGFLIFIFLLFVVSCMLWHPVGRVILGTMFLLVAIPVACFWVYSSHEAKVQAQKEKAVQAADIRQYAQDKAKCVSDPTKEWNDLNGQGPYAIGVCSDKEIQKPECAAPSKNSVDLAEVEGWCRKTQANAPTAVSKNQIRTGMAFFDSKPTFSDAYSYSIECYKDADKTHSWSTWDRCSSFDYYVSKKLTAEYFSSYSIGPRANSHFRTIDGENTQEYGDRYAGIKGIVDQLEQADNHSELLKPSGIVYGDLDKREIEVK